MCVCVCILGRRRRGIEAKKKMDPMMDRTIDDCMYFGAITTTSWPFIQLMASRPALYCHTFALDFMKNRANRSGTYVYVYMYCESAILFSDFDWFEILFSDLWMYVCVCIYVCLYIVMAISIDLHLVFWFLIASISDLSPRTDQTGWTKPNSK